LIVVLASCANSTPPGDGCEWVDQPPPLALCAPGQDPSVDENLSADCTALTRGMGDWLLGLAEQGREVCGWSF
jgi:hypothetical protein